MDIPAPDTQDLIHLLINIATHQIVIMLDMRDVLQEQRAINERLEKLLQGLLPPCPNGQ